MDWIDDPGPRPRRPSRPKRPRETVVRTERIWCSEDDSCNLGDLLQLIPADVTADRIHIAVEKNPNGYRYTTISYDYEAPNTKYQLQFDQYLERQARFEQEMVKWTEDDADWHVRRAEYDEMIARLQREADEALGLLVA